MKATVWSKPACPFCTKAKNLLKNKGIGESITEFAESEVVVAVSQPLYYYNRPGDGSGTTLAQLVTAHSAHAGKIYKSTFEYRCNYYVMFSNNGYVTDNVALPRTTDSAGDSISSGDAFKTAVVYFKCVSAYIGNFRMNADANVATNTPADAEFNYKNWTMYELSDNNLGTMTNMTNADFESDVPS